MLLVRRTMGRRLLSAGWALVSWPSPSHAQAADWPFLLDSSIRSACLSCNNHHHSLPLAFRPSAAHSQGDPSVSPSVPPLRQLPFPCPCSPRSRTPSSPSRPASSLLSWMTSLARTRATSSAPRQSARRKRWRGSSNTPRAWSLPFFLPVIRPRGLTRMTRSPVRRGLLQRLHLHLAPWLAARRAVDTDDARAERRG